jgi:hypothetical protein
MRIYKTKFKAKGTTVAASQRRCEFCQNIYQVTRKVLATGSSGTIETWYHHPSPEQEELLKNYARDDLERKLKKKSLKKSKFLDSDRGIATEGILCPHCHKFSSKCLERFEPPTERGIFRAKIKTTGYDFLDILILLFLGIGSGLAGFMCLTEKNRDLLGYIGDRAFLLVGGAIASYSIGWLLKDIIADYRNRNLHLKLSDAQIHKLLVDWCLIDTGTGFMKEKPIGGINTIRNNPRLLIDSAKAELDEKYQPKGITISSQTAIEYFKNVKNPPFATKSQEKDGDNVPGSPAGEAISLPSQAADSNILSSVPSKGVVPTKIKRQLSSLAVFSLVLGMFFPFVGLPMAIVAVREISKSEGRLYGKTLAWISIVLNSIMLAMLIFGVTMGILNS